jgi:hypothetical protein
MNGNQHQLRAGGATDGRREHRRIPAFLIAVDADRDPRDTVGMHVA